MTRHTTYRHRAVSYLLPLGETAPADVNVNERGKLRAAMEKARTAETSCK